MSQTLRGTAGHWPWLLAAFALTLPPLLLCMLRCNMPRNSPRLRL